MAMVEAVDVTFRKNIDVSLRCLNKFQCVIIYELIITEVMNTNLSLYSWHYYYSGCRDAFGIFLKHLWIDWSIGLLRMFHRFRLVKVSWNFKINVKKIRKQSKPFTFCGNKYRPDWNPTKNQDSFNFYRDPRLAGLIHPRAKMPWFRRFVQC